MLKRIAIGILLALLVMGVVWTAVVVSYEENKGTDNVVNVSVEPTSTNQEEDLLATLSFEDGGETLKWASLEVSVTIGGVDHACGFGQQSVPSEAGALVKPHLGADGQTFTTVVDATNEASFTHLALPEQVLGTEAQHTMRFSSTDVFLSEGVRWAFVEDVALSDVNSTEGLTFSNDTSQRLEWYDYDITVHRVTPVEGVYVLDVNGSMYKVQFVSYYNEDDERRYPTIMVAAFSPASFPALLDPSLVSPAPCLIVAGDDDLTTWDANETVQLFEHDQPLRSGNEVMVVSVRYEGVEVRIVESPSSSTE
jgi:hypothetical protein